MFRKVCIALLLSITLLGAIGVWYVRTAAPVAAGLIAKQLCTLVFESQLPPEKARALYFRTLLGHAERFFKHHISTAPAAVLVTGVGQRARALHRPGLGCTLLHPADRAPDELALRPVVTRNQAAANAIDYQARASNFDQAALERALDTAFLNTHQRNTLAVAVLHKGALVAERYANGVGPQTPLPGWSLAKSATATLVGMMRSRGLLQVEEAALFSEWAAGDHRHKITLDQLLRMTSGIDLDENGSGLDATSLMLFTQNDSAGYALTRGLRAAPGAEFAYSSGSTVLVAHYLTQRAGGPEAMYALIRELFDSLGMHSAIFEPDATGTFIGSSFMVASARDWAKLGQLYLNQGRWHGKTLFDPDWLGYVRRPTTLSQARSYAAGFMGRRPLSVYQQHNRPPPPADTLAGHGLQNQALYILPSQSLVVVRLGASGSYWDSGEWQLVADLIAAQR